MDLLYSAILLFLIALIWLGVIFFILNRAIGHQIKKDKWMLFGGLLFFIAMIVVVVAGTVAYDYIESPGFCGTFCHIMEPYYDSYISPGNNSMMALHVDTDISCSNCHEGPGLIGKVEGLLRSIPEAYYYYTNTYDPENLGGDVSREYCLKCHDGKTANVPGNVETATNTTINPHNDNQKCINCHVTHYEGFGLSEDSCSLCHGISIENFEEMLSKHSERTEEDCMKCHNRKHPDDALISFSEYPDIINTDFCSDCHEEDVTRFNSGEHKSESCMDCHNEHDTLQINFNSCLDSCHILAIGHDLTLSNCSVCHDLSTVHSKPGIDADNEFKNIICSRCHDAEESAYEKSYTPESIEIYGENGCIDCHDEHKAIIYPHLITSPYDDCSSCHSTYDTVSTVHDRTGVSYQNFLKITNEFCSSCHLGEFTRFSRELHNAMNCTDCHGEHNTVRVKFNYCISCHDLPSDHTTSLTSCSGPECHDQRRAIHSDT